jgi:hypothetical protein
MPMSVVGQIYEARRVMGREMIHELDTQNCCSSGCPAWRTLAILTVWPCYQEMKVEKSFLAPASRKKRIVAYSVPN